MDGCFCASLQWRQISYYPSPVFRFSSRSAVGLFFFFPLALPLCCVAASGLFSPFSSTLSASLRHKGLRQARGFEHGQLSQTSVSPCLVQIQNPKSKSKSIHLPDIADPCIGVYVHASSHPYRPPGFCRVRSATPHLDGRHPESAKKGSSIAITAHPLLQDPFLSLLCVDSTCESAPPDHHTALLKVDWPSARLKHSYTTHPGPKKAS